MPYALLTARRSLSLFACLQIDSFSFSKQYRCVVLGYFEEETDGEDQDGLLPLDCTRSLDVLYFGSKRRSSFVDRIFSWTIQLQFCDERTLIYLDRFAIAVLSILFACKRAIKVKKKNSTEISDWYRRCLQRWKEKVLSSCQLCHYTAALTQPDTLIDKHHTYQRVTHPQSK